MLKKKIWVNFQRISEIFTKKIVTKLWDPGSGKNLFRIPDPGVKKALDPGSGSATLENSTVTDVHQLRCLANRYLLFKQEQTQLACRNY